MQATSRWFSGSIGRDAVAGKGCQPAAQDHLLAQALSHLFPPADGGRHHRRRRTTAKVVVAADARLLFAREHDPATGYDELVVRDRDDL
jgi:hypothetical protein